MDDIGLLTVTKSAIVRLIELGWCVCAYSLPLNRGLPSSSSANIHPMDQTSTEGGD